MKKFFIRWLVLYLVSLGMDYLISIYLFIGEIDWMLQFKIVSVVGVLLGLYYAIILALIERRDKKIAEFDTKIAVIKKELEFENSREQLLTIQDRIELLKFNVSSSEQRNDLKVLSAIARTKFNCLFAPTTN